MKSNSRIFNSVNNSSIIVETIRYENKVLKIIVRDKSLYRHRKKIFIFTLIALFNLYGYYKEIFNLFLCGLIQVLILYITQRILVKVRKETLLIVKSVGIQWESHSLLHSKNVFIPWNNIKNLVINEVISMQQVLYLLIIITKAPMYNLKGKRIIPLFHDFSPRLPCLQYIFKNIQFVRE